MRNVMCWHDPVTRSLGEFHSATHSATQEEVAPVHRSWSHHSYAVTWVTIVTVHCHLALIGHLQASSIILLIKV